MLLQTLLPRMVANSSIMGQCHLRGLEFSRMHGQKSWTFLWRPFLEHRCDVVAALFAKEGGWLFDDGLMSLHNPWTFHDATPTLVVAPITLISRIRQWAGDLPFSVQRWPIHSLWMDVTMQPFDRRMCKTKNPWCSVYAHIDHIETEFGHWITVSNEWYNHYWHPVLRFQVLSFACRSLVSSQFQINLYRRYLSGRWTGPITFLRFRPAIYGMWIISLVFGKYSSTSSRYLIQLLLLDFHDIP